MGRILDHDRLAAKSAIACWFGDEGQLALAVQQNPIDNELLDRWLRVWMLRRWVPVRNELCAFLDGIAKPVLIKPRQAGDAAYRLVEELCQQAMDNHVFTTRQTSLMSKFAFSCHPTTFAPYDRRARTALRELGHRFPDHSYTLYMHAFNAEKPKFVKRLRDLNMTASTLSYRGRIMQDELFEMRAFDKRLMLLGGFSPVSMARNIDCKDFNPSKVT